MAIAILVGLLTIAEAIDVSVTKDVTAILVFILLWCLVYDVVTLIKR